MKRALFASLMLVMAVTLGCGKKQEEQQPAGQPPAHSAKMAALVDPVDGKPVEIAEVDYSWVYKDVEYYFNSEKNLKAFQQDPEKYIAQMRR
ncbi:MAG: YHS domain-containing protein [Candidatus Krumholzibacteria bacterium]|nr:YHS domain-containing protein [Candidatus Krumholzibacteria bacterium]